MKRTLILAATALAFAAPAIGQEYAEQQPDEQTDGRTVIGRSNDYTLPPGTTVREKLTHERRNGNDTERKTRERSISKEPIKPTQPQGQQPAITIINQPPAININNNNTNTNTNPVNVTSAFQSQQSAGRPEPALAPVRPGCSIGVVTNLGLDQFGRPIFANVRTGPGVQFGNVSGPDLTPVILPDGAKVAVCSRMGRWLGVEIPTAQAPIQGWVFERYVGAL
jgi:hypothetical protein